MAGFLFVKAGIIRHISMERRPAAFVNTETISST